MDYAGLPELRGAKPWFVMAAITQLEDELLWPGWCAFEWGCGGSTLWLSQWCADVVSVEHDAEWYEQTGHELDKYGIGNVELLRFDLGGPYEAAIEHYLKFDLIMVDGRNRAACIAHAVPHLYSGGILVLDNSERTQYQGAIAEHLAGWKRWDHESGNSENWTTTIWRKP